MNSPQLYTCEALDTHRQLPHKQESVYSSVYKFSNAIYAVLDLKKYLEERFVVSLISVNNVSRWAFMCCYISDPSGVRQATVKLI
jgi:hypothetical protein